MIVKKIIIDDPIKFEILNKTELFDNKKNKTIKSACLFTDTYRIIGVLLNEDGLVTKISDLLLDEAADTIETLKALGIEKSCFSWNDWRLFEIN